MSKETIVTISQLIYEVAQLVALCAASCAASSVVLAAVSGMLGYIVAVCAGFGAVTIGMAVLLGAEHVATNGRVYLVHRYQRFVARRRNDKIFYSIDC